MKRGFEIIKDLSLGNEEVIKKRLAKLYGYDDWSKEAKLIRNKNFKNAMLIILIITTGIVAFVFEGEQLLESETKNGNKFYINEEGVGTSFFDIDYKAEFMVNGKVEHIEGSENVGISKDGTVEKEEEIIEAEAPEIIVERKISQAVTKAEEEKRKGEIILPQLIEDDILVNWQIKESDNRPFIMIAIIIGLILVYKIRYVGLEKMEKSSKESVIKELPGFINKLLLLLSGGMIFNDALQKISSDYEKNRGEGTSYFYDQLVYIRVYEEEINRPAIKQLEEFAKNTEIREFIRVTSIIREESKTGGNLKEKLRNESDMLWLMRKKEAEERGKKAETKMSFPLVLLLLVMMLLTITPTFMTM